MKRNQKGFTLVELLVVIAIIGILAVVAVPALFKNINKAKVADVESDYSAIKSASLSYYADENTTPESDATGDNKKTWSQKLADHMDSVPTKSSFGGEYAVEKATSGELENKLVLTIEGPKITTEQMKKLRNDIGSDKIYKGSEINSAIAITTDDAISEDNIYIVLIDNVNM